MLIAKKNTTIRILRCVRQYTVKCLFYQRPIEHPHSEELRAISEVLDEVEGLVELVEMDRVEEGRIDAGRGRPGMSAEQVLRAAIVQQLRHWTFDELAWHLADSRSLTARSCAISNRVQPSAGRVMFIDPLASMRTIALR